MAQGKEGNIGVDLDPELFDYLPFGTNFYDQSPFSILVNGSGIDQDLLRGLFTYIAKRLAKDGVYSTGGLKRAAERRIRTRELDLMPESVTAEVHSMVASLGRFFPHWHEYISEKADKVLYGENGEPNPSVSEGVYLLNPTIKFIEWDSLHPFHEIEYVVYPNSVLVRGK
ncbi:MAG: hypothetical protein HYT09_00700 [Candidatus Levybacteria bacterium]|nr:hypothetical protein [Candidatus Levybacteria bacterium]